MRVRGCGYPPLLVQIPPLVAVTTPEALPDSRQSVWKEEMLKFRMQMMIV